MPRTRNCRNATITVFAGFTMPTSVASTNKFLLLKEPELFYNRNFCKNTFFIILLPRFVFYSLIILMLNKQYIKRQSQGVNNNNADRNKHSYYFITLAEAVKLNTLSSWLSIGLSICIPDTRNFCIFTLFLSGFCKLINL